MKYASLGSISHGTLRTEDLLNTFADELEYQIQRNAKEWCSDDGRKLRDRLLALARDARECFDDNDEIKEESDADEIVQNIADELMQFAAPYCYFGANEGDGSDFGYWPCMDQIDELPHVNDSDEAKALGEDCKFVNDHGNVTVYGGDGEVIFDMV